MIPIRDGVKLHTLIRGPGCAGGVQILPAGTYTTRTRLPLKIVEGPYLRVVEDVRAGTDVMVGGWSPTRKQSTPAL